MALIAAGAILPADAVGRVVAGHEDVEKARSLAVGEDREVGWGGAARLCGENDRLVRKIEEQLGIRQRHRAREVLQVAQHRPEVVGRILLWRTKGEINLATEDEDGRERIRHPRVPFAAVPIDDVDGVAHLRLVDAQLSIDPRRQVGI